MGKLKKRVSLLLEESVLKKVDKERNGISRSYYVNKILKEGKYGIIQKK